MRTTLTHFFVLDATELCTEICSCLALQSQLYSSYKSRTTLKDLIGISPNGSISFVSELWSGSISDRELVIQSVMFCFSKKNLSSHSQAATSKKSLDSLILTDNSQAVLPFNFLFFFFLLSDFLHLLLVDLYDCFTSVMFCLSKKKKILIIAFTSIVLHVSIPLFFLTSFVFADRMVDSRASCFLLKNFFRHIHEHCCYLSLFCFSDTFGFFGKWFVIT